MLLHKPRKRDAWQLPQGGVEAGETTEQAALRELKEEASVTDCSVIGVSEHVYQYDFPPSFRRFRPDNVKGQHIKYIFALAQGSPTVTVDNKEVDAFVWTDMAELGRYIKRKEYTDLVQNLYTQAVERLAKPGQAEAL